MALRKKLGVAVAVTAATAAIILGGSALANADPVNPSPSASSSGTGGPGGGFGRGPGAGTEVTGDEATKVTAAVTAKDPAVTVTDVRKGPDGDYRVRGTKDGNPIFFQVSADLKTVSEGRSPMRR